MIKLISISIVILGIIFSKSSFGHGESPKWLMDGSATGKYTSLEKAEFPSKNDFTGTGCCGKHDCIRVSPFSYKILENGSAEILYKGETYKIAAKSVYKSEDIFAWFCRGEINYNEYYTLIRPYCLFMAPQGM